MGIILLLYYSSRVTGYKSYRDLADNLIDTLLEDINSNTNFSFSNGLAGIVFAINQLIKDKFIDADPDDIFINVDKKIYLEFERRNINDFAEEFPLFSYGLYLLERSSYGNLNSKMGEPTEQAIDLALNICEEVYNSNFCFNFRTIAYTNSVLYFLIKLNENKKYSKRENLIIELIIAKIIIALNDNPELWNHIEVTLSLGMLINKTNPISNFFLSTVNQFSDENKLKKGWEDIDLDINKAWQGILFSPSYNYYFDPKMFHNWINDADLFYDNNKLINNVCRYLIVGGLQLLKFLGK